MKRHVPVLILCAVIAVVGSACATKKFVREQVGATEAKLGERVDTQDSKFTQRIETQDTRLRETSERTAANAQALDATGQKVQEVGALANDAKGTASDAKQQADSVANGLHQTQTEFSQRFSSRNKFSMIETKTIYFDFNKSDLRDEGINELGDIARALTADPNAVVELQGFADPRGSDRYNYQLTRERVDAVVRYLVQRHGIDLRRIHAVGMGKAVREAGERATKEEFAKSRRVDIRLLAPQS
jgi:outer membrane protein OmpA-like peptidoglycan-associated protein